MQQLQSVVKVARSSVHARAHQHDAGSIYGEADGVRAAAAGVPRAVGVHADESGGSYQVLYCSRVRVLLNKILYTL